MTLLARAAHTRAPAREREGYRPDIDGLRAVAVLLVVTYHVWLGRVSGGVDVFLMISAFFLTATFAKRLTADAPLRVGAYWLRTFARLLPLAAVTLAGVLVTAWLVYPPTQWAAIWEQTWASLFYGQNWLLAADSVDYYARQQTPSPLQHFWSLSVQGQVFVLWPLLFALATVAVRRWRLPGRPVLIALFAAVFAASLAWSIWRTAEDQAPAYFETGTRLWEFAAGSLVALLLPLLRLPRALGAVLSWAGLLGIVVCGLVIDAQGGFPGYLALWPVLCTAAVMAGAGVAGRAGAAGLLSWTPLRLLGRDAYALYLVHWPILITFLVLSERTEAGLFGGALVIALSLALARALTWAVDERVRAARAHPRRAALMVGAAVLAVAVPLASWQTVIRVQTARAEAAAVRDNPGGAVLFDDSVVTPDEIAVVPAATDLDGEWVSLDAECRGRFAVSDPLLAGTCRQTEHAGRARHVIVYAGDSHMQQLAGAFLPVAEQRGWGVVSLIRGGCAMGLDETGGEDGCPSWRDAALRYLETLQPDAVVTVVTRADAGEPDEALRPGIEGFVERMREAEVAVVGVRDNPRFAFDMYRCALDEDDATACFVPQAASLAATDPSRALAGADVTLVDLTAFICPDEVCGPVIGNVAVYMDAHHLTHAYARTLAPAVAAQVPESIVG